MDIVYSQTAEIRVPGGATNSRFYFNNLPNLRCKPVMSVQTYSVSNVAVAPSQTPVINNIVAGVAFLTLVTSDNVEVIKEIPYGELFSTATTAAANPVNNILHTIASIPIVWEKSYITLGATAGIAATDEVFLFNIYYKD